MVIFGAALLLFGVLALLVKLGVISGSVWGYFWPLVLIFIGLAIIFGRRRWHARWHFPPDDDRHRN